MSYSKYYPGGWQSGERGGTPITPEALNHMEKGIEDAYKSFIPAVESAEHPGCYYRTVNGVTEWFNPPMIAGKEYRTTERMEGKAVYAKRVVYKSNSTIGVTSGVTAANIPHNISGFANLVRQFSRLKESDASSFLLPYLSSAGKMTSVYSIDTTTVNIRIDSTTWTEYTYVFDLYYTKSE